MSASYTEFVDVTWCVDWDAIYRIFETSEENENDEKAVSDLRSELWQKEMKLTDIRLEALSSAHQLEQLREAMNNMQVCRTVANLHTASSRAQSNCLFFFISVL